MSDDDKWCPRAIAASLLFAAIGVGGLIYATVAPTSETEALALVFNPGMSQGDTLAAVAASGGNIVRFAGAENIIVADFRGQDLDEVLRMTGASFAMDPGNVSVCGRSENL